MGVAFDLTILPPKETVNREDELDDQIMISFTSSGAMVRDPVMLNLMFIS
jgi:hypothetical protein